MLRAPGARPGDGAATWGAGLAGRQDRARAASAGSGAGAATCEASGLSRPCPAQIRTLCAAPKAPDRGTGPALARRLRLVPGGMPLRFPGKRSPVSLAAWRWHGGSAVIPRRWSIKISGGLFRRETGPSIHIDSRDSARPRAGAPTLERGDLYEPYPRVIRTLRAGSKAPDRAGGLALARRAAPLPRAG